MGKFLDVKDVVPDIILLDIVLHEDSDKSLNSDEVYDKAEERSYKLTKIAKSIFPNVILIMHSTHNSSEIILKYMNAGADSYICKSTDPERLGERIIHEYELCKRLPLKVEKKIKIKKESENYKHPDNTINCISEIDEIATEIAASLEGGPYKIEEEVMEILEDYEWHDGSILELTNVIESMIEKVDKRSKTFSVPMLPLNILESM